MCIDSYYFVLSKLINHRAKRGGSLFQGSSGEERGRGATPPWGGEAPQTRSRSDPYFGVGYPSVRRFSGPKLPLTLTDLDESW